MEETKYQGKLTITVKKSQSRVKTPALPDDIVKFIAKFVAQFCPKMALTIWSEYRHDGMLFHGHPRLRSGQAWSDWGMFEWFKGGPMAEVRTLIHWCKMHPSAEPLTGQICSATIPWLYKPTPFPASVPVSMTHDGIFLLQHFLSAPVVEQQ